MSVTQLISHPKIGNTLLFSAPACKRTITTTHDLLKTKTSQTCSDIACKSCEDLFFSDGKEADDLEKFSPPNISHSFSDQLLQGYFSEGPEESVSDVRQYENLTSILR